ncbi:MAG TPA: hypothetical protein PLZ62_02100 [bacterium]|nr:hypothetical protein [bacterium]
MSSFQKICNLIILSVFILEIIPITPALAVVDEGSNISTNITTNTPTTTSTTKSSTQKTVYKQRPTETTFLYIQNATNVSESFQTWAKEIDQLDEGLFEYANNQIVKVDTVAETEEIIEKNNILVEKTNTKYQEIVSQDIPNTNEYHFAKYLLNHYQDQATDFSKLKTFNEVFEYLVEKSLTAEEKKAKEGSSSSHSNDISDTQINNSNPYPTIGYQNHSHSQQIINYFFPHAMAQGQYEEIKNSIPNNINEDVQNVSQSLPAADSEAGQSIINTVKNSDQGNVIDSNKQELPPVLDFNDPAEKSILLPLTYDEYIYNQKNGYMVDERIYFLLFHILKTFEMEGEIYESYIADKVIQDATTPGILENLCGELENDPSSCKSPTNICGIQSAIHFLNVATGAYDNLGVPYKDRAHIKIWLGLNSPDISDEIDKDETTDLPNPHREFMAVDISEIGLYNESVDCTGCKGLPSCKFVSQLFDYSAYLQNAASSISTSAGTSFTTTEQMGSTAYNNNQNFNQFFTSTAHAQSSFNPLSIATGIVKDATLCLSLCFTYALCYPCCPRILDTANTNTIPVKVQWQNEDYGSVLSDVATQAIGDSLSLDTDDGFNIKNLLKGMAKNALEQLFSSNFSNLDLAGIAQGGFSNFMSEIGNQWLDSKIFSKLGLPEGFASGVNWLNPDLNSLSSSIAGGYLDESLDLDVGSFTPIISAAMSGDLSAAALSTLNLTPNLNLPPALQSAMSIAVQNGNNTEAMALALSNLGLKQLNNKVFGWPDGILDIDSFSGEGFIGIANKLGQKGLSKINGFPSDYILDISNPKQTAASLGGALLSSATKNQTINNQVTSAISNNGNISLNSVMQSMSQDDLAKLFNTNPETSSQIYDYLQNPDPNGFAAFRNDIISQIDFEQAAANNPNFTSDMMKQLIDYGTNPAYADNSSQNSYTLATLANSATIADYGLELSQADTEKIAYLQDYLASNSSASKSTIANQFVNKFSETLPAFQTRLLSIIDSATSDPNSAAATKANTATSMAPLLKVKFNQTINTSELGNYDYLDTVYANSSSAPTIEGTLRSLNLDLRSVKIIPTDQIDNIDLNNISNISFDSVDQIVANQAYYILPKIDVAELLVPGIRSLDYQTNSQGTFKLIDSITKISTYSNSTPISINLLGKNDQKISSALSQDPLQKAFKDKYQMEYTKPDKTTSFIDTNTLIGGSTAVYNALKNTSAGNNEQLTDVGVMAASSALAGLEFSDIAASNSTGNGESRISDLQSKLEDLTRVAGIVKSWQTGDISSGTKSMVGFLKDNGVFEHIAADSSWNVDNSGNISVSGVNLLDMFDSIQNGDPISAINNIDSVKNQISKITDKLGTNPTNLLNVINNPSSAPDTILDIMSNKISSESGLEKVAIAQEITSTLGTPPNFQNIPKLLSNSTIQSKLFSDINPDTLNDISNIYGLVASGDITPQKAASTIMTANFFQEAIGQEDYQEFMQNYGGLVNAALTADPQTIASAALSLPKVSEKINAWLSENNLSNYFNLNSLQGLINGDINGFIKNTAMNYINDKLLSSLSPAMSGLLSGSIMSILNGEFPTEAITQFASQYLINSLLSNPDQALQSIGNSLSNGLSVDPTQIANGMIENSISGAIGNFVFKRCQQQIAQDNIIHLDDIILSYDRSPFNHRYYQVMDAEDETQTNNDNQTSNSSTYSDSEYTRMQNYYPLQIFSDYNDSILSKLKEKAEEKFTNIWYENRSEKLNLFRKKCSERQNQYLQNCEDAIHVGF